MTTQKLMLTFDTEDFVNNRSMGALYRILLLLKEHSLEALFFITGHMAERISYSTEILDLLTFHEIGYHSSSHSVRPNIFEYTDVKGYRKAYLMSMLRETSHINPLTGKVEGRGGIESLANLFPSKKISSFRAPGFCWSPPHLDALADLGIRFDFSACISPKPTRYDKITFYPYPSTSINRFMFYQGFSYLTPSNKIDVLVLHPASFVNRKRWDSFYFAGNPRKLYRTEPKSWVRREYMFSKFELFLKQIKILQRAKIVEVTADLSKSAIGYHPTKMSVHKIYRRSMVWPIEFFHYKPRFLLSHYLKYFNIC